MNDVTTEQLYLRVSLMLFFFYSPSSQPQPPLSLKYLWDSVFLPPRDLAATSGPHLHLYVSELPSEERPGLWMEGEVLGDKRVSF